MDKAKIVGPGADLRGADLRGADLRGADLADADLVDADLADANLADAYLRGAALWRAYLQNANLAGADLRGADLADANLTDANLRGADLADAYLRGAALRGADLADADLQDADLRRADLRGADLTATCLDPMAAPNGETDGFERIPCRDGTEWCVGYRTRGQPVMRGPEYEDGEIYQAPVFSTADAECHPGLYVMPKREQVESDCISVLFRPWECHKAGDKWRVRWFMTAITH